MLSAIGLLMAAFILSAILVAITGKITKALGFVAHPDADRFHQTIIPLGGGIAIFTTIATTIVAAIIAIKFLTLPNLTNNQSEYIEGFITKIPQLIIILIALTALFLTGLLDDIKNFSPFTKLAIQFIAAIAVALWADVRVELFIHNKLITALISAVWIVFIINAFNFLDNMDGLSAGIATIVLSVLFVAAALSGQFFVGTLELLIIATLLGFLIFNFPPAKIFMGDAGSMVIGLLVAICSLKTTYYHHAQNGQWYPVLMPLIVLAVPLYDFISVTFLRLCQGKSPFVGDTQHFSHRMKKRGLTDTQVVLTLYLATLCTAMSAIFLYQVNLTGAILIFAQTVMILIIIAIMEASSANDKIPN